MRHARAITPVLILLAILGFVAAAPAYAMDVQAAVPVVTPVAPAVEASAAPTAPALDLSFLQPAPNRSAAVPDFLSLTTRYVCVCASDEDCPICPNGNHRICDPEGCGRVCLPC